MHENYFLDFVQVNITLQCTCISNYFTCKFCHFGE